MANLNVYPIIKVSGYLEKKAKLRIGSPWKKYWFVLEGRLLLYYRSKDEYETLSPCKGSINLCPPCNVKPALSAACVFQIECRASTVTLRAESRQEQERWMQAVLAAIAQSKSSPNRMSHFRYSLDDLPKSSIEDKKPGSSLSRQNTLPHRISTSSKKEAKVNIIERLQNIGAQTYGGSLGAITKLTQKDQDSSKDLQNDSTNSPTKIQESPENQSINNNEGQFVFPQQSSSDKIHKSYVEDGQCSIIQEENSMDLRLDDGNKTVAIIENEPHAQTNDLKCKEQGNVDEKENKGSLIIENDQYLPNNEELQQQKNPEEADDASFLRHKQIQRIEHLYERISGESSTSENNRVSQIRQNSLYERFSNSSRQSDNSDNQNNKVKLNPEYSVVHKDLSKKKSKSKNQTAITQDNENEYSMPIMDHNKNSLLVDNDQYIPTVDDKINDNDLYREGLIFAPEYIEYAAIDKTKELEELYEDPDRLKKNQSENSSTNVYQDVEPVLPPRPDSTKRLESCEETSSQTSSNEDKKSKHRFKLFSHLMKSDKKNDSNSEIKRKPKRRTTSFLRRVWRRKAKSLDSDEDDITYETVDYDVIEKRLAKDKNDIEMLQELQNILETRKNLLQEKLNSGDGKGEPNKQSNEPKIQPTVELKELLEIRADGPIEDERPSLPPRQNSQPQSLSPYHDVPQNNQAVNKAQNGEHSPNSSTDGNDKTPQPNKLTKSIQTIDDILKDLDEEKDIQESRQKVKQLIEKFNEFQNEDEVILRRKSEVIRSQSDTKVLQKFKNSSPNRDSDELTVLLEELSKVTSAPVMTPGVTSSLVNPVLTDEEWLQLIPIRRRRLSDPDYDVPRPHRSLQLHGSKRQVQDNPIPATRFFGPILPPSANEDNVLQIEQQPSLMSMDPDSLEIHHLPILIPTPDYSVTEKDFSVGSYASHAYPGQENQNKVIYAEPKMLTPKTKPQADGIFLNLQNNDKTNAKSVDIKRNNLEEMFIDSLEPLAEISTVF